MEIKNSARWQRHSLQQAWIGIVAITMVALAIRYWLHYYIEPFGAFHFFTVGAVVIEYLFGYRFAIISLILGGVLGEYFFVAPYGEFDDLSRKDFILLLNYVFVTGVAIVFLEKQLRAAYSYQLLMKVMESRHKLSLQRENDRLYYARKSIEASVILENKLNNFEQIFLIQHGNGSYKVGPMFYRLTEQHDPTLQPEDWTRALHPEDVDLLKQHLSSSQDKLSSIRVLGAEGQLQEYSVMTDRYKFADDYIAVLRIVGNTELGQR